MSVILGYGGYIEISREWPEPTAFPQSSSNGSSILCREKGFWTGQRVWLYSRLGVPLIPRGSSYAPCPDGHRFWGGLGVMGPNTDHRTGDGGPFWRPDSPVDTIYSAGTLAAPATDIIDPGTLGNPSTTWIIAYFGSGYDVPFWETAESTGFQQITSAYIHRDQLDRLTFFSSENSAINKNQSELISFSPVVYQSLLIAPYNSSTSYKSSVELVGSSVFDESPSAERPASFYVDIPDTLTEFAGVPENRGWAIVADCKEWALQTDPTVLDSTAIGEDFGDSVKDVVRGSGSFNSFVSSSVSGTNVFDSKSFIRLMLMTETGSKARARFRIQEQARNGCKMEDSVWIECDILLGPGEISVSVDNAVSYSSQFVVVKDKDGVGVKPVIGVFS